MTEDALLHDFQKYLNEALPFTDLELGSFGLLGYFSTRQEAALEPVAEHGSQSVVALWQAPQPGGRPIVWLDSEGVNYVLANSLAEFLQILPYSLSTLYDIMAKYDPGRRSLADADQLAALFFPPGWQDATLAKNREEYEGLDDYLAWLHGKTGLTLAPDPVAVVRQATATHPSFADWLAENT